MAGLLKRKDREQLSRWIGKECHFVLLYKLINNGGNSEMFHRLCDGKGPTVTVFYNTDNNVYGGYLSQSWKRNKTWSTDETSFLFQLYSNGKWRAKLFPYIRNKGNNFWGGADHGPWFYDLHSFVKTVDKTSNYYSLDTGDFFRGSRYDMAGEDAQTIANGHNNVTDLEVYMVNDVLDTPWREPLEWNIQCFQELKSSIATYEPFEEANIAQTNILLIGQSGSGKSSFVNTINTVFKGEISSRACTGRRSNRNNSLTEHFTKFQIRDLATKRNLKFRICDSQGIVVNRMQASWILHGDLISMLEGNLPNHYQFKMNVAACDKVQGFVKEPTLRDQIHVVVFVIDGNNINMNTAPEVIGKLHEVKDIVADKGIPHLAFLTKIDMVCGLVEKDITNVFMSEHIERAVDKVAAIMDIPRNHVFPVKNYEKETKLHLDMNILHLEALRRALLLADDYLENQCHLEQESAQKLNAKD